MPKTNEEEVNVIEETIVPEEDDSEEEDEEVIPPLEEEPSKREIEELNKASKSSPDAKEEQETEEPEVPKPIEQPKPVEGETPRERAFRKEIETLRARIRNKEAIVQNAAKTQVTADEYDKLKDIYSDEEIKQLEVVFDVIGKKKGYVKQEEMYAQSGNEILDGYIEAHPEYKPENDPDDIRWNTFTKILAQDYNLSGKKPKELTRIFDKVHADVLEEFGEAPKRVILNSAQRNAQIQKVKSASHGGGTKTEVPKKSNAPTDPKTRAMFKDFDDDDF